MSGAVTFRELRKDAVASDSHVPTALGNQHGKKRARLFHAVMGSATPKAARVWSMPLAIAKADPEQRLIFGWASIVERDGEMVIDKQGDIIPVDELERAAYDFALYSREQGEMHLRKGVGRMVESMVFTPEKQKALGVDLGKTGWWVGFKVDDDQLWAAHKRGERPEFSIGGAAHSVEI